jgi:hypothetical protein
MSRIGSSAISKFTRMESLAQASAGAGCRMGRHLPRSLIVLAPNIRPDVTETLFRIELGERGEQGGLMRLAATAFLCWWRHDHEVTPSRLLRTRPSPVL